MIAHASVRDGFPSWYPHPDVWLLLVVLGGGYWLAHRRWGGTSTPAQRRLFVAGLLVLWLAADWPLHDLSEGYLYSAHMVQHVLISLVVPPLLLLGTPVWLARRLLAPAPVMAVMRTVTRPLVALLLFNGVIVLTHVPAVVSLSLRSEPAHFVLHAMLFTTATLMWWPVLSPLPELPRLQPPAQMLYLFLQSIVPTVPASWLTWADGTVYKAYDALPKLWGLSAVNDQRTAGVIMKVMGGFILWGFIAALFFRWNRQDALTGSDQPEWQDVERRANRLEVG